MSVLDVRYLRNLSYDCDLHLSVGVLHVHGMLSESLRCVISPHYAVLPHHATAGRATALCLQTGELFDIEGDAAFLLLSLRNNNSPQEVLGAMRVRSRKDFLKGAETFLATLFQMGLLEKKPPLKRLRKR